MKKVVVALISLSIIYVIFNTTSTIYNEDETQTINFFAMDTYISLKATGKNAVNTLEESKAKVIAFEKMISHTDNKSELYKLNNNKGEPFQVTNELYTIIEMTIEYSKFTNGIFDPTIGTITNLWGITQSPRVPSENEIETALKTVSYENIILLDDNYIQLKNNATIELGALGKGIAADFIYEIYQKNKIKSGIISLAGNVYLVGEKAENTPWTVGITDPENPTIQNISVKLKDISIVTAGAYERYFYHEDEFYHHIFDSKTGYPTTQDVTSVTIVSNNSTLADVISTTLFAMGFESAIEFLANNPDINAVIINENNEVYITQAIKDVVTLGEKYKLI